MMSAYNISDHWTAEEPTWVKSLVSSLERRYNRSHILPLSLILEEISRWVDLASGVEAWNVRPNRLSLLADLDESTKALGDDLQACLRVPLEEFKEAFVRLINSQPSILKQSPGLRTDAAWNDVASAAQHLLDELTTDVAAEASFNDLVATARNREESSKRYRPIADLFFDQLKRRGREPDAVFSQLVSMLAFGRGPNDSPFAENHLAPEARVERARVIACTPARVEPVVVWLGYRGPRPWRTRASHVAFMDAHWAVPNAAPGGQQFEHKEELWELTSRNFLFKVAKNVDETSDVDSLVRVNLGETTAAGAPDRAIDIVNVLLNIVIHNSGGTRPRLVQYGVLQNGHCVGSSFRIASHNSGFPEDRYGDSVTADALEEHAPRIADALARHQLPGFLAAALEVQALADHPFSREMALRKPSHADISEIVPLADRVVQHVAAYAAITPNDLLDLLGERWPHSRWLTDVQRAVQMCLAGDTGAHNPLRDELISRFYSPSDDAPWILFVADRTKDLLSLCRLESERAWIERVLRSVIDHIEYARLIENYRREGATLAGRRRRVRNSLVHGNPTVFTTIASVREYSEFLGGSAIALALNAFVDGIAPITAVQQRTAEYTAMSAGTDAASYWQNQKASMS